MHVRLGIGFATLVRMGTELVIGVAAMAAFGILLFKYAGKMDRRHDLSPVSQQWLVGQRVREEP